MYFQAETDEKIPLKQTDEEDEEIDRKSQTFGKYFSSLIWEKRYLLLVVLGAFFNSLRALLSKVVLSHINAVMTGFTERATMVCCCIPAILWYRLSLRTTLPLTGALCVTGVLSAAQIILIMMSYNYLNVGDAGAILSCTPVLVGMLGWIFLSEKLSPLDVVACLVATVGVTLLSHPSQLFVGATFSDNNLLLGLATAVGAALSIAVGGTLRRLLCLKEVNKDVSLIYINFIGALVCSVVCTLLQKWQLPNTTKDAIYLLLSGIFGYLNNLMIMIALHHEKAYHVYLVNSSSLAMLYILQFIFLKVPPDVYSITGSLCVIIAVVVITRIKTETTEG